MHSTQHSLIFALAAATTQALTLQPREPMAHHQVSPDVCYAVFGEVDSGLNPKTSVNKTEYVQGVKLDWQDGFFNVTKDTFLSVPNGKLPFSNTGVCNIFFHPTNPENEGPAADKACDAFQANTKACRDALFNGFGQWDFSTKQAADDCDNLSKTIQFDPPKECSLAGMTFDVTYKAYSTNDTLNYFTEDKESVDCWPTKPGFQLLPLDTWKQHVNSKEGIQNVTDRVLTGTPILTISFSGITDELNRDISWKTSCVKPLDGQKSLNDTLEDLKSSVGHVSPQTFTILTTVLFVASFFMV